MTTTTTNLADFGCAELQDAQKILQAIIDHGLPDDFDLDGVQLMHILRRQSRIL